MLPCVLCHQPIAAEESWEYFTSYPIRTPESDKQRVHARCVAAQLRELLRRIAELPEDVADDVISFEL